MRQPTPNRVSVDNQDNSMAMHDSDRVLCERWYDVPEERSTIMAELYHRHSRRVYAYCKSMSDSAAEAEDLFQDAWLRLIKAMERDRKSVDHIDAYLLRIVRNQILNQRRSKVVHVSLDDVELILKDRPYEHREAIDLLYRALEILPEDQREAFLLHEIEGMSYDALAAVTGETVATLRNRAWRARAKLRDILAPVLGDLDGVFGDGDSPSVNDRFTGDDEYEP